MPLPIKNVLSNEHNNKIPHIDFFATNLLTSSSEDQFFFDEISYSYDRTTSYPTDSVVLKENKLCIGINFSTDDLKYPSTTLYGSSSSVISGITTPFSLRNIDQN